MLIMNKLQDKMSMLMLIMMIQDKDSKNKTHRIKNTNNNKINNNRHKINNIQNKILIKQINISH